MKNEKMMDLIGNINSKYVNEAAHATTLSRVARRRFSLGNVAVIAVGLIAVSIVTFMAFWLSDNLGQQPTDNGYAITAPSPSPGETPAPSPTPGESPAPTPAPDDTIARAHAAARELLLQYPTIFLTLMSRHTGLDATWDQIRSHVDYTGTDFLWTWASTMDDSYLMDGVGNIITQAPFLAHADGPVIAWRYFLFDTGNGIPLIIIDFQPHWIGSGRYHVFMFDGTDFVPVDSTQATWHHAGGGIDSLTLQPFMNDADDLIINIEMGLGGSMLLLEDNRLNMASRYSFDMVHEWGDQVTIWHPPANPANPYAAPDVHAELTRAAFEAYRESPAFFSIFPNMPEGDFRMLAPMPQLKAQLDAEVYQQLRQQTPASTHVAPPPPTPTPRTEYQDVEDHRSFDYFMEHIRESGIHIVTQPQDSVSDPEHEFIASMWFNGEYWVTTMYEFESVYARVMAMDMHGFWRGLYYNGRFMMETNHPWLGEFFEGIP